MTTVNVIQSWRDWQKNERRKMWRGCKSVALRAPSHAAHQGAKQGAAHRPPPLRYLDKEIREKSQFGQNLGKVIQLLSYM